MSYWKLKFKSTLLLVLNALIFLIPLIIMFIIYKDDMLTTKSATGVSGLAIIGVIMYICGLKHAFGKFPTITWYLIILLICVFADYVSEFLVKISLNMLIGYVLTIPLSTYIRKIKRNADTVDELDIREKYKKERKKNEEIEENEISGRV